MTKNRFIQPKIVPVFFPMSKIENCKSSAIRVAEIARQPELSSRGKRTFEIRVAMWLQQDSRSLNNFGSISTTEQKNSTTHKTTASQSKQISRIDDNTDDDTVASSVFDSWWTKFLLQQFHLAHEKHNLHLLEDLSRFYDSIFWDVHVDLHVKLRSIWMWNWGRSGRETEVNLDVKLRTTWT